MKKTKIVVVADKNHVSAKGNLKEFIKSIPQFLKKNSNRILTGIMTIIISVNGVLVPIITFSSINKKLNAQFDPVIKNNNAWYGLDGKYAYTVKDVLFGGEPIIEGYADEIIRQIKNDNASDEEEVLESVEYNPNGIPLKNIPSIVSDLAFFCHDELAQKYENMSKKLEQDPDYAREITFSEEDINNIYWLRLDSDDLKGDLSWIKNIPSAQVLRFKLESPKDLTNLKKITDCHANLVDIGYQSQFTKETYDTIEMLDLKDILTGFSDITTLEVDSEAVEINGLNAFPSLKKIKFNDFNCFSKFNKEDLFQFLDNGGEVLLNTLNGDGRYDIISSFLDADDYIKVLNYISHGQIKIYVPRDQKTLYGDEIIEYCQSLIAARGSLKQINESLEIDSSLSQTEKVKTIIAYMLKNMTYSEKMYEAMNEDPSGKLFSPIACMERECYKDGVLSGALDPARKDYQICGTYAALFSALCKLNNIDCQTINGGQHVYNYVTIDDVQCIVDVTFMDTCYDLQENKLNVDEFIDKYTTDSSMKDDGFKIDISTAQYQTNEYKPYYYNPDTMNKPDDLETAIKKIVKNEANEYKIQIGKKVMVVSASTMLTILAALGLIKVRKRKRREELFENNIIEVDFKNGVIKR